MSTSVDLDIAKQKSEGGDWLARLTKYAKSRVTRLRQRRLSMFRPSKRGGSGARMGVGNKRSGRSVQGRELGRAKANPPDGAVQKRHCSSGEAVVAPPQPGAEVLNA
jgi:hypothetical protein